jgi:predicted amidohydrolase
MRHLSPRPSDRFLLALAMTALLGTPSRARADEGGDDALRDRYRVTVLQREVRGDWTAWLERREDLMTRAMRRSTCVVRQRSGGEPEDLVIERGRQEPEFRLHESGWLVASSPGEHAPSVWAFAPPISERRTAGVVRPDLALSPQSRFLVDGFLSVGRGEDGKGAAGLRIAWAPLGTQGLGLATPVAFVAGEAAVALLPETQVRVRAEPADWVVSWMVPLARNPAHGAARIARSTYEHRSSPSPLPRTEPTVHVAAVQCPSVLGDVATNRARLTALVEEAAADGAKVIVLPETAVTGYLSQDLKTTWQVPGKPRAEAFTQGRDPHEAAERVPGPSTEHFARLARRLGVYVTVPLLEFDGADGAVRYFNTVVLVGPDGRLTAHYRKLNPWPHPEQSWAEKGDRGLVTFDTAYGRIGLAICFDVHSVFAPYGEKNLWALLYPIAWVSDGDDAAWFGKELPARTKSAGFHLVGANWSVDEAQPWHGYGHSVIVRRDGTVLASAKTKVGSEILYADLPLQR